MTMSHKARRTQTNYHDHAHGRCPVGLAWPPCVDVAPFLCCRRRSRLAWAVSLAVSMAPKERQNFREGARKTVPWPWAPATRARARLARQSQAARAAQMGRGRSTARQPSPSAMRIIQPRAASARAWPALAAQPARAPRLPKAFDTPTPAPLTTLICRRRRLRENGAHRTLGSKKNAGTGSEQRLAHLEEGLEDVRSMLGTMAQALERIEANQALDTSARDEKDITAVVRDREKARKRA